MRSLKVYLTNTKQINNNALIKHRAFFTTILQQFSLVFTLFFIPSLLYCQDFTIREAPYIYNTAIASEKSSVNTFSNPSLLINNNKLDVTLYFQNKYSLSSYNTGATIIRYAIHNNTNIHCTAIYKGINNYYTLETGFGVAHKLFKSLSLGIRFRINEILSPELKSTYTISPDVGISGHLFPNLKLAIVINNPVHISENDEAYKVSIGALYHFNNNLEFAIQADKTENDPIVYKLGVYADLVKSFSLFIGLENSKTPVIADLSYTIKSFDIHIGSNYHEKLGFSAHIAISKSF